MAEPLWRIEHIGILSRVYSKCGRKSSAEISSPAVYWKYLRRHRFEAGLALYWLISNHLRIDTNRGRAISEDYLPSIIRQLRDDYLADFAIPVLFNICVDYGEQL